MGESRHRVLILDADAEARERCRSVVAELAYQTAEAADAEVALAEMPRLRPHLVIFDWDSVPSPQENFLGELMMASAGRVPQVLVTCAPARAGEVGARVKLLGIDLVLIKPVEAGLLRLAVAGAVTLVARSGVFQALGPETGDLEEAGEEAGEETYRMATIDPDAFEVGEPPPSPPPEVWRAASSAEDPWDDETSKAPFSLDAVAADADPPSEWGGPEEEGIASGEAGPSPWEDSHTDPGADSLPWLEPEGAEPKEDDRTNPWLDGKAAAEIVGTRGHDGSTGEDVAVLVDAPAGIEEPAAPAQPSPPAPREASRRAPRAQAEAMAEPTGGRSASGRLEQRPFVVLLIQALYGQATGKLTIRGEGLGERRFSFLSGRPVSVSSDLRQDGLIPYLAARGHIDRQTMADALKEADAASAPHEEVVLGRGLVDPLALLEVMRQHVVDLCVETAGWSEGTFHFVEGPPEPTVTSAAGIDGAQVVVLAMIRHAGTSHIDALATPPSGAATARRQDCPLRAEDIRLGPREARVRDLALAGVEVSRIVDEGGMRSVEALAVLRALALLGAITFVPVGRRAARSGAVSPAASPAAKAPSADGGARRARRPRPSTAAAPAVARPSTAAAPRPVRPSTDAGPAVARPSTAAAPRAVRPSAAAAMRAQRTTASAPSAGEPGTPPPAGRSPAPPSPGEVRSTQPPGATPSPAPIDTSGLPAAGLPPPESVAGPEGDAVGAGATFWGAYRALGGNKPRPALGMFRLLVAMEPRNTAYHLYLGWATYKANRKSAKLAERCILEASNIDRTLADPFLLMAEICRAEGEVDRAEKFQVRGERLSERAGKAAMGLDTADESDIRREMERALKDAMAEHKKAEEAPAGKGGLLDRLFKK